MGGHWYQHHRHPGVQDGVPRDEPAARLEPLWPGQRDHVCLLCSGYLHDMLGGGPAAQLEPGAGQRTVAVQELLPGPPRGAGT